MSATSVQFTVAAHVMAALAFFQGKEISSATLAESVNADPTFVRKSLSKLSKAGLIVTTRGKNGASTLTRSPKQITLLDIYRASAAPATFAIHSYPVHERCPISRNIKGCMASVLKKTQNNFENTLDGITLADVVGEIRQTRRSFSAPSAVHKKGSNQMNSHKDEASVGPGDTYVILGATGNTGSIIADFLLSKGRKVRVVGRDAERLRRFVRQGAEAFTADMSDSIALTKAFSGARAAYLVLPPITTREDQERQSDAFAKAAKESGLRFALYLSSYGAHVPEGTGPVTGLHSAEQKLNAIGDLNALNLRAAYFMENNLAAIGMIRAMGIFGHALRPDLKIPMIATLDVGNYAAQRLLDLDFSGKQTRELLGERDLTMTEVTAVIARGIGKPDLRYEQFPYDQMQQALMQVGFSPKKAAVYIEMFTAINTGVLAAQELRSPENSTATSFEKFVRDVFVPAYPGKARTA